MSTLARAIAIAAQAHVAQKDKAGQPYVLHPLRLMFRMETDEERMAAVLHDVVEDTEWTLDALRTEGFPPAVLRAVDCLTHRDGEGYEDFVRRAAADPVARRVKLADIEDNMDMRRIADLTDRDLERLKKYHAARRLLVGETT